MEVGEGAARIPSTTLRSANEHGLIPHVGSKFRSKIFAVLNTEEDMQRKMRRQRIDITSGNYICSTLFHLISYNVLII